MGFAELLTLATLLLEIVTPIASMISKAYASGTDVTEALAAQSVAGILAEQGHLDAAMSLAHANRLAEQLKAARDDVHSAPGDARGWAYIEHALSAHALVVAS